MSPRQLVRKASASAMARVRLEGSRKEAIETGRNRLLVASVLFSLVFGVIGVRLVDLMVLKSGGEPRLARVAPLGPEGAGRAEIVDRNGIMLATSLPTASLYANPREILDPVEAADRLLGVFPGMNRDQLVARLQSESSFVWLRRNLTPREKHEVNRLGIPGFKFQNGERRVYPQGRQAAHVLGLTDVDGRGIAGVEKTFDRELRENPGPLRLSIDIRVQSLLHHELSQTVAEFEAIGGVGVILDVRTGELLAMVSLPDFDPNAPVQVTSEAAFNRVTKGVYEMGSTFKVFNTAIALDSGATTLRDGYDASRPIQIARFTINDFHGKNRWLTVPEIFIHSSNIGSARMAIDYGGKAQQAYLGKLGLLKPASVELPEVGSPLVPSPWREINTMTIAYGHGLAVSPLQLVNAVATVVNGGIHVPATVLRRDGGTPTTAQRALSEQTSLQMRWLMREVVKQGTGTKADVEGYRIGGKTGTADKIAGKSYRSNARISSFVGAFPIDDPRFAILIMVDEPRGNKSTYGYATGGWVAAPTVARLVRQVAPLYGLAPTSGGEPTMPVPGRAPTYVAASGDGRLRAERSVASN